LEIVNFFLYFIGLVSPPGDQGKCPTNSAAFANTAAIEACFAKVSGQVTDLSEQLLVDCAPVRGDGANKTTCAPSRQPANIYLSWVTKNKIKMATEAEYPYLGAAVNASSTGPVCQATNTSRAFNPEGRIKKAIHTSSKGTERILKKLVLKYGAVVTTVSTNAAFRNYKGGVFSGCPRMKNKARQPPNHVVAVVGFGRDEKTGRKYWLIKNSMGTSWGEKGFMRLRRDVNMCGIGRALAVVECEPFGECAPGDASCLYDAGDEGDSGEDEKDEEDEE
jgi:cathepsin L